MQATVADVKNQSKSLSEEMKSLRSLVFQEVKDLRSSMAHLLATVNSINESVGGGKGGAGRGGLGARGLEEEVEQQK